MATEYRDDLAELQQRLAAWRVNLADELETNMFRTLPKSHPSLANTLRTMTTFPNAQHVVEYAFPTVSSQAVRPVRSRINIAQLTQACERYFPFTLSPNSILKKFVSVASAAFIMDGLLGGYFNGRSSSRAVIEPRLAMKRAGIYEKEICEFRCAIPTESVLTAINLAFLGLRARVEGKKQAKEAVQTPSQFRAWVPQTVLFKVMPEAVEQYGSRKKAARSKTKSASALNSDSTEVGLLFYAIFVY